MIKALLRTVLIVIVVAIGINIYLQPNDLSNCQAAPSSEEKCQSVDAIVAISGGDTQARAETAINLYKNGWAKTLIFSGAAKDKTGPSNADVMKEQAIAAGVPESAIQLDKDSETTQQNAKNVQAIFAKLGVKKAILVTSGYHQRRASLEFNKWSQNVKIVNSPTKTDRDWSTWWWTTPHSWWLAFQELGGIAVFYFNGLGK
jgi:uncharacterized SAM-binding protein YcdF (DUF218 family)